MHVIMSETYTNRNFQTMCIEVVDKDPGTGTDVVIARYDVNIPVPDTTETLYRKARETLLAEGFRAGTWQDIGGAWRAPVERVQESDSQAPKETTLAFIYVHSDSNGGRMDVEVVGRDGETGIAAMNLVRYQRPVAVNTSDDELREKATSMLLDGGYRVTSSWERTSSYAQRASVEQVAPEASSYALLTENTRGTLDIEIYHPKNTDGDLGNSPAQVFFTGATIDMAASKVRSGVGKKLAENGYHIAQWVTPMKAMICRGGPPVPTSEADAMLASSQTLALYALKSCDKAKAEASVGNRDHTKNHTYMKARAALDAHCEQLAQLMWIRKVQEAKAGGVKVLGAPSAAEAEKYLRELAAKEG